MDRARLGTRSVGGFVGRLISRASVYVGVALEGAAAGELYANYTGCQEGMR